MFRLDNNLLHVTTVSYDDDTSAQVVKRSIILILIFFFVIETNAARLDMFHRPRCTWRSCEGRTEVELASANYRGRLVALTT